MSKRITVIISAVICLVCLLIALIYFIDESEQGGGKQELSSDKSLSSRREVRFLKNGCPEKKHQDWIIGKAIGCEISPDKKFIGKFIFNGLYKPDRYYEIFVINQDTLEERKVLSGDFRTLGWEWTEDNKMKILYNCGTGCIASKIIELTEAISLADYKDGGMNSENGWSIEFSPSF